MKIELSFAQAVSTMQTHFHATLIYFAIFHELSMQHVGSDRETQHPIHLDIHTRRCQA
jgi:hypothetical protein